MKLVFSTFVFGNYQKYIPYYIYSVHKTQPNSYVKIFVEKPIDSRIQFALDFLNHSGIVNFEIIVYDTSITDFESYDIKGGGKKIIRWILDPSFFSDFDYVYMGDIDIIFIKEKYTILDFHKQQLDTLKLPFSNKVRLLNDTSLSRRLTGLHFFKQKEYFYKIQPIISRIKSDQKFKNEFLNNIERDEHFLYKLNMQAFNFDPHKVSKAKRPWHGIHVGITRGNKDINLETIENNSSVSIIEITQELKKYTKDPIFKEIQKHVFVIELDVIFKNLSIDRPFYWRYSSFNDRIKKVVYKIQKKIVNRLK